MASIVKLPEKDRDGRQIWHVFVCRGVRPDGKPNRKSERVHGGRPDAERRAAVIYDQLGREGNSSKLTVSEWIERYLRDRAEHLAPLTLRSYRAIAANRINPFMGKEPLSSITPRRVHQLLEHVRNKRLDGESGNVGAATLGKLYRFLHVMFQEALYRELIQANPVAHVRPPAGKTARISAFTEEESHIMLRALKAEPLPLRLAFTLALTSGMRRGELIGLRWSDVDMDTGILRVERSAYRINGEQTVKTTKSAKGLRTIRVSAAVCSLLVEWKTVAGQHPEGYIFTWQDNGQRNSAEWWHIDFLTKAWTKFLDRNDLRNINFHGLRHTAASLLLTNGLPVTEVAHVLGHNPATTMSTYSHVIRDSAQRANDVMEGIFSQKTTPEVEK